MSVFQRLIVLSLVSAMTRGAVLDVPFVHQKSQGCGPASVAMLIEYWRSGDNSSQVNPDTLYDDLYDPRLKGTSGEKIAGYLRNHSFFAFILDGTWSDLTTNLARQRPVIVCLQPGRNQPLHYVVVVGVNESDGSAMIHDPARRPLIKIARNTFEIEWRRTGSWTLIAVPRKSE